MLHLFKVRMNYDRREEWYDPPNYWPIFFGWLLLFGIIVAFVLAGLMEVWLGFLMSVPVVVMLVWIRCFLFAG